MFNEKIKPSLVLTLICLIACALLVVAYEATYVDSAGIITEEMTAGLDEIYGGAQGFEMLRAADGSVYAPEGVTCVLKDGSGNTAFEITTDGYSSGGLHVLVGVDNSGAVSGVSILSIGETPGLGTRVQDPAFLGQFKGLNFGMLPADTAEEKVSAASCKYKWWQGSGEDMYYLKEINASSGSSFELDAVTGATFSSKGMNRAVTIALAAYDTVTKGAGLE